MPRPAGSSSLVSVVSTPEYRQYHLVGVAGVGMSALAQVLLAQGYAVSGSDRFLDQGADLEVLRKLRAAGVALLPQDGSGVNKDLAAVVVSTAIEKDNPDIAAARERLVPVMHRVDVLACLALGHRLVAVTGTSGKTTVTGMLGWIFECLGQDPTVVNGGAVVNWRGPHRVGNVRFGRSPWWIVEADESDRSLLRFDPEWAVITNITRDHFEVRETATLFQDFARRVRVGIICGTGVSDVVRPGSQPLPKSVSLVEKTCDYFDDAAGHGFWYKGVQFRVPAMGRHNAENAFAAVLLCDQLGMNLDAVRNALASFGGIERRLEPAGEAAGIRVLDDYAHNPAKIRAAWKAVAGTHPRILGVWRPHGFGPLYAMLDDLAAAFVDVCRPDDRVFLLPVFYAGGSATIRATSDDLAARLAGRPFKVELVKDYDALAKRLVREARAGDAVLCMGARDPALPAFARRVAEDLRARWKE